MQATVIFSSERDQQGWTSSPQSDQSDTLKFPVDINKPLPFEDVLLPTILVAREMLCTRLGIVSSPFDCLLFELLSGSAYQALERNLLQGVSSLCMQTLEFEFRKSRPLGHSLLRQVLGKSEGEEIARKSNEACYKTFVKKLLTEGLSAFFHKYPVLGRLVATKIDFWVEAVAEFLERLKTDFTEIQSVFSPSNESAALAECCQSQLGKVTDVQASLSDPHHCGRSVLILTFESGMKLVYKPKDLSLEAGYVQLLDWLNHQGLSLPFKVIKILRGQGYGWVEHVEHLPCADEMAAKRFYERSGILQCLLYVLGTTDCHNENIIASSEHPVLVDMETLMRPSVNLMENSPKMDVLQVAEYQQEFDSVLSVGLLPEWTFEDGDHIASDTSGLGGVDPRETTRPVPKWESINTDDMQIVYKSIVLSARSNGPTLDGKQLSPNDYLDDIVSGFKSMYCFLIEQRQNLLSENGPLATLRPQKLRFVVRPTKVYATILQKSRHPKFLKCGLAHSIELEHLSRAFLHVQDKPVAWPILRAELTAMEQMDIPYFEAYSDSSSFTLGLEQPIEHYFEETGYDRALARLQKLDKVDLSNQVLLIEGAFHARAARSDAKRASKPEFLDTEIDRILRMQPFSSEQLLEEACRLAQEMQERAIRMADGSVNWLGLKGIPDAERFKLIFLDENLYSGRCGVALFLAALDSVVDNAKIHELALRALQPVRKILQNLKISNSESIQLLARSIGIGGASGLGSIIYSLVKISQFLKDQSILEDARKAAALITPDLIAADKEFDVIAGAAGSILGLLPLYDKTGDAEIIRKAIDCGQHLLSHRLSINNSPRAWKNSTEQRPLTGFAHGAAGITYALLQLYAVVQDKVYLDAALEGIAYERLMFSEPDGNWVDLRVHDEQISYSGFMIGWCNGAPGIGLARLGSLQISEIKDDIWKDVEIALQTTRNWLDLRDHLCCGNFGQCEVLLVASQKLERPYLAEVAQRQASWVITKAQQNGGYKTLPYVPYPMFNYTFFQGTAGIGYQLLRLAYPEMFPSVLLWE
jgi:type 2 lantibiotic biosynthesis protein LanM